MIRNLISYNNFLHDKNLANYIYNIIEKTIIKIMIDLYIKIFIMKIVVSFFLKRIKINKNNIYIKIVLIK